jgi:enoyl-CoA hydratase
MSDYRSLRIQHSEDGIAELILLGPARGNAMGPDFWRELPAAVAALAANRTVRAVVVHGDGGHFSYGLDLPAMAGEIGALLSDGAPGRVAIVEQAALMQTGFDALARMPQPVIAAVDGWCIGAGIEMIAACDIRLGTTAARFALREVKVGIVPDLGGIQRLPHLVGEAWARQLALTGDEIDADTALRIGLLTTLAADAAALRETALDMARRIAANPPLVVAGIKRVMNARCDAQVAEGNREAATLNGMLMQSEDFAEAMRAFMEKRAPTFRGR